MPVPAVKLNEGRGEMTIEWIKAQLADFLDGDHLKPEYKFERGADLTEHPAKDLYEYLNSYNKLNYNPLQTAIDDKNTEVVRFLLNIGPNDKCPIINVNQRYTGYYTSLHLAIERKSLEIIKMLIDDADATLGLKYTDGDTMTPLYSACQTGNIQIVKIVLKRLREMLGDGKPFVDNINSTYNQDYTTPLFTATIRGFDDIVEELKRNGVTLGGGHVPKKDLEDLLNDAGLRVVETLVNRLSYVTDTFGMKRIPGGLSKTGGEGPSPLFKRLTQRHPYGEDTTEYKQIIEFLIKNGFRLKDHEEHNIRMLDEDEYAPYLEQLREVKSRSRSSRSRSRSRSRNRVANRSRNHIRHRIFSSPHRWNAPRGAPSVTRRRAPSVTRRRAP